ncbi:MAG TPA: GAF domain-containing protein, partial [Armatimonadetes bacterium]|nr:GAF domain-containing protein [Armatimonadota bacterium]
MSRRGALTGAPSVVSSQIWISKNRDRVLEQWEAEVRDIVAAGASVLPERWDSIRALGLAMLDFASNGTAASYRTLERATRQCITDWGRRVVRHAVNCLRRILLQQGAPDAQLGIDASAWEALVEYWHEWWLMSLQLAVSTEGLRVESFLSEIGELLERWQRAPAFPHDQYALWRDIVAPGIVEEMHADACSIYYWDRRRRALNLVVTYGWQVGRWSHNQSPPDAHIAEQTALRKEPIRVRIDSCTPKAHAHLTPPEGFQMSLHIPLWFGDQFIGILGLMFRESKRRISRRRRDAVAAKVAFLLKMLEAMCAGTAPQAGTIPIEDMQVLT